MTVTRRHNGCPPTRGPFAWGELPTRSDAQALPDRASRLPRSARLLTNMAPAAYGSPIPRPQGKGETRWLPAESSLSRSSPAAPPERPHGEAGAPADTWPLSGLLPGAAIAGPGPHVRVHGVATPRRKEVSGRGLCVGWMSLCVGVTLRRGPLRGAAAPCCRHHRTSLSLDKPVPPATGTFRVNTSLHRPARLKG